MLFKKDPFNMFGQAVDVRIHGSGIYSEVVEAPLAFRKALAVNLDLK
jgi:hypothetical protein